MNLVLIFLSVLVGSIAVTVWALHSAEDYPADYDTEDRG